MDRDGETFGINPSWIYRKTAEETRRSLGLKPTQIDEAIAKGTLPPPVEVVPGGKAKGWLGQTLFELQRQRLAAAAAKHHERSAQLRVRAAGELTAASPKHVSKQRKRENRKP